ncbi:MAG TPA: Ig domain-containing protein, partial [Solirubrobacteraceae bacterium]|nr:Ig domain-containing protein [Solirubrobacteraceae bacterium]
PTGGEGATIPVSTLGGAGSPEQIVAGAYEDTSAPSPSSSVITCTGTSASPSPELTGCAVAGGSPLTVHAKDDLVQVIAKVEANVTIPAGPNKPNGEGGLESLKFLYGNASVSPITTYLMNLNAPNRIYVDGATVYCTQANANPTTKLEDCTSAGGAPLTVHAGDAITADPIVPARATMTTGLDAPDGIVGTLPSYPGAPEGSTVVLYTQKVLSYFIVGTTDGPVEGGKFKAGTVKLSAGSFTINYKPSVTESEPLPASGSFKIYLGTEVGQPIQTVTCKGVAPAVAGAPAGSEDLTECSGGTGSVKEGNWIGGPNAATAPLSALEQIGEGNNGKSKGPQKLFGNNEDLTVLRAAWTSNGSEFHDLGAISGSTSGTGSTSGEYNDLSNPLQTVSPSASSPSDLTPGSEDTDELRYVGSRGSIVRNPDGGYGLFLSGAWATDGDSDAFNQIFYAESINGREWSVPKVVLSTEYQFNASREQDEALKSGIDAPLGISGYYSGRAYGPAVVQNPGGSLTMVFAGYRIPKPVVSAGTKLGTNPTAPYVVDASDPALYRDILTMNLKAETPPTITSAASATFREGQEGSFQVSAEGSPAPSFKEEGDLPAGVSFDEATGVLSGTPTQEGEFSITFTASNGVGSNAVQSFELVVQAPPAITSPAHATFQEHQASAFLVSANGTPAPTIAAWGTLPAGVSFEEGLLSGTPSQAGTYEITFFAANGIGAESIQQFTLTVEGLHVTTTSLPSATVGVPYEARLQASGGLEPCRWTLAAKGLPKGLKLSREGVISGTVRARNYPGGGSFPITVTVRDASKMPRVRASASLTLNVSTGGGSD